jgi:hypothetical protein
MYKKKMEDMIIKKDEKYVLGIVGRDEGYLSSRRRGPWRITVVMRVG